MIGILALLPVVVDLIAQGRSFEWTPLHVLSPVTTIDHALRGAGRARLTGLAEAYTWLGGVTAFVLLLNLPAMARGAAEVLRASGVRRARPR